jgi:hypothetical protein
MFGAEDRGRSTLAHFAANGVSGERLPNQHLFWHAANVTRPDGHWQARRGESAQWIACGKVRQAAGVA